MRAFAFPAAPDSSINFAGKIDFIYRLTLTTGGFIDHALPMALKASLEVRFLTLAGAEKLDPDLLFLESGMIGVFVALDLFLFYVFWEVMLVPMYFLIGIWGGPRRVYAAVKFFLYTMAGSILMLVAIIFLGIQADTFNVPTMLARLPDLYATGAIPASTRPGIAAC